MIIITSIGGRSVYLMTMHTSAPSFHPFRGNSFTCALLASPYPRHPALCRQDTTFTWRLDGAVTTLMFVNSFSLSSVFPPRSTDPIQFPTFRRHFECTGRSRNHFHDPLSTQGKPRDAIHSEPQSRRSTATPNNRRHNSTYVTNLTKILHTSKYE